MEKDENKASGTAADLPVTGDSTGKEPELAAAADSGPQPQPQPQEGPSAPVETVSAAAIDTEESAPIYSVPGNPSGLEISSDASDVS